MPAFVLRNVNIAAHCLLHREAIPTTSSAIIHHTIPSREPERLCGVGELFRYGVILIYFTLVLAKLYGKGKHAKSTGLSLATDLPT